MSRSSTSYCVAAALSMLLWVSVSASATEYSQPEVVMELGFGDADSLFARDGITGEPQDCGGIDVVRCFAATEDGFVFFDAVKQDLKFFDVSGRFLHRVGGFRQVHDIHRVGDRIVVLQEKPFRSTGVEGYKKHARYRVVSHSIHDGSVVAEWRFLNLEDAWNHRGYASPYQLLVANDRVFILNIVEWVVYPVMNQEAEVPKEEQVVPAEGVPLGDNLLVFDRSNRHIRLVDNRDQVARETLGMLAAVSPNRTAYAIRSKTVSVFSSTGQHIAEFDIASDTAELNRESPFAIAWTPLALGPSDQLYGCYETALGVRVLRWSRIE